MSFSAGGYDPYSVSLGSITVWFKISLLTKRIKKSITGTKGMLPTRVSLGFSFFGSGDSNKAYDSVDGGKSELVPSLKLQTDKDVYRPGESIVVSIEIHNPSRAINELSKKENAGDVLCPLLVERLSFEIKGIEKLDSQWYATQKSLPGSKQKRGLYCYQSVF